MADALVLADLEGRLPRLVFRLRLNDKARIRVHLAGMSPDQSRSAHRTSIRSRIGLIGARAPLDLRPDDGCSQAGRAIQSCRPSSGHRWRGKAPALMKS